MKLPVIARQITHLTDARYFAALEVDYLTYDLGDGPGAIDELSYKAITEWVEGPKVLIENPPHRNFDAEVNYVFDYPLEVEEPDFVQLDFLQFKEQAMTQHPKGNYIIMLEEKEYPGAGLLKALTKYEGIAKFFFQSEDYPTTFIQFLIEQFPLTGIVLKGSAEDKPGFKSYEDLDDLIELLEVY